MGKEFDLGTGRTALGDNHWVKSGGAKAKVYAVCCAADEHLIPSRVGFLGRTGSFSAGSFRVLLSWMRRRDRMIRALTNQGVGE
jgi:hypothetical protein